MTAGNVLRCLLGESKGFKTKIESGWVKKCNCRIGKYPGNQGRRERGRAPGQQEDAGPLLDTDTISAQLGEFREYYAAAWQGQVKWG